MFKLFSVLFTLEQSLTCKDCSGEKKEEKDTQRSRAIRLLYPTLSDSRAGDNTKWVASFRTGTSLPLKGNSTIFNKDTAFRSIDDVRFEISLKLNIFVGINDR